MIALPAATDNRPFAPLGPPPLCSYPRGLFAAEQTETVKALISATVDDWAILQAFFSLSIGVAEVQGAPKPVTWQDCEDTLHQSVPFSESADARYRLRRVFAVTGVKMDEPPPADFADISQMCLEWALGNGRFADSSTYRIPPGYNEPTEISDAALRRLLAV